MQKANIVFMGTPEIAVPTLEKLNELHNIQLVVTTPDKPKGRGLKLQYSPIKEAALKLGLPVLQPVSMKEPEFCEQIRLLSPDIIVVFAFRILPPSIFSAAKIATFNIHTSLLPKYRGAAPINWAIINGDKTTGITTFILQEAVDTGDILLQEELAIPANATAGDLYNLFQTLAPSLAIKTCDLLLKGNYELKQQDHSLASLAPKIFRRDAKINWCQSSEIVANFINGYSPEPCAFTIWNNATIKIYRALSSDIHNAESKQAGDFFIEKNKFFVKCSDGFIEILELQAEGKKRMLVKDFLAGYRGDKQGTFIE